MDVYQKEELKSFIKGLTSIFNVVRIVDPIENKVPFTEGLKEVPVEINCYDFWKTGGICENCISVRALEEDRVVTKIEYNDKGAFLVIAKPIILYDKMYIIEMLLEMKDIDIIVDLNKENNKKIKRVITRLEQNLLIDELTGVYNRRFINKQFPADIEEGKDGGVNKLAVIMVDVDDFKDINDVYGHLIGDYALEKVAAIISSRIRNNYDWVARYGGDEFIILLKNADEYVANKVIKSIQEELDNTIFISSDPGVKITLSFGIHILEPRTISFEKVLEIVDENLKKAKHAGKNKAVMSPKNRK